MFSENEIRISQIANGWQVILPHRPMRAIASLDGPFRSEMAIRREARIMKDEMLGDALLDKLTGNGHEVPEIQEPQFEKLPWTELKNQSIYTFKTFTEVLAFLKVEVDID